MDKMRTHLLTLFFFLLPWQTRYIFNAVPVQGEAMQFGIMSIHITEIILLGAMLIVGKMKFHERTARVRTLTLVLVAIAFVTTLTSPYLGVSLTQWMHLVFAMLLFFALLDTRINLRTVMTGFVAGLIGPAILGIYQYISGGSPASSVLGLAQRSAVEAGDAVMQMNGERTLRAYGSFPHPNIFGGYLAVGIVTLLHLANTVRRKYDMFWVYIGTLILLVFGIVLTFSRSAWLGLALAAIVSVMVIYMKRTNLARKLVVPVAFIFIAASLFITFGTDLANIRPGSDTDFESRSIDERASQYEEFWGVFEGQWILGNGIGSYALMDSIVHPEKDWWIHQPIHNVFLLVLAEMGLLGALALLAWSSTIDKMNFARFPNREAIAAFAMGNVVLMILFFDHYIWSSWAGLALIAYVMALTVRLGEENEIEK
jgi:hypothetical protein